MIRIATLLVLAATLGVGSSVSAETLLVVRKTEPAHWHYDVRFMFEADAGEPLVRAANESKELAWVDVTRVKALNPEESMARMVRKTLALLG